ncbi:F-box protein At5g25290-like [Tripterygium wilfordii]|uniref:F-box protein At5g25290-like n=1 Tax=Tripterygium wilfordii TaxID=458696 RepID=UPI0018F8214A|nr:F-box protein At5g25290-like [Tripterygium wilfordii]
MRRLAYHAKNSCQLGILRTPYKASTVLRITTLINITSTSASFLQSPNLSFSLIQPDKLLMELSESNWAWLPKDILDGILDGIVSFYDYARFGAVCKHWYSVAKQRRQQLMELWSVQLPLLMFPSAYGSDHQHTLYNVTTSKTYDFKYNLPHYQKRLCGYSHGWFATTDKGLRITLRNPFLNQIITLPPMISAKSSGYYFRRPRRRRDYDKYWIYKLVLSHNPYMYPDKYEVVVLCDECLAVLKPGTKSWVYVYEHYTFSNDIIYYEGMLLLMDNSELVSIIVNESRPRQVETRVLNDGLLPRVDDDDKCVEYLAKSSEGDLLYIRRYISYVDCKTTTFRIYSIRRDSLITNKDKANEQLYWHEVRSLGDDALFLGDRQSFCVKSSNFPDCKPDAIYFVPHFWDTAIHDMGVFNLKDESITPHYDSDRSPRFLWPPSVWMVPTLGSAAHLQLKMNN